MNGDPGATGHDPLRAFQVGALAVLDKPRSRHRGCVVRVTEQAGVLACGVLCIAHGRLEGCSEEQLRPLSLPDLVRRSAETGAERVAFSGPRHLLPGREEQIAAVLDDLPAGTLVLTGGCVGVDAAVARLALARGLAIYTILPPNLSQVDPEWRAHCSAYEQLPTGDRSAGAEGYRLRNTRMVSLSTRLVALPDRPYVRGLRSGTWMTVHIAERAALPIDILLPPGRETAGEGQQKRGAGDATRP